MTVVYLTVTPVCAVPLFLQEVEREGQLQVPHSTLSVLVLHASGVCVWNRSCGCVWRLYCCLHSDPLLQSGVSDVDGSRGSSLVPETSHCLYEDHKNISNHSLPHLLE